jgi:signal transduction histidine kinase
MFVAALLHAIYRDKEARDRNKAFLETASFVAERERKSITSDIHDKVIGHLDMTSRSIEIADWGDKQALIKTVADNLNTVRATLRDIRNV